MVIDLQSNKLKVLKGLIYTLVFILPIVFTSATIEGFEFPKTILIYFSALSILTIFVLMTKNKLIKPGLFPTVFLLTYIVTSITSVHLYTSLFGYYSRFNGGLISILAYGVIYYVTLSTFTSKDKMKLKYLMIAGSVPVGIYAIYQFLVLNAGKSGAEITRVYSTIGQANWLGAYLAFCLLLALSLFLTKKLQAFFGLVIVLCFTGLWFTFSVSSLLGIIVGILVLVSSHRSFIKINLKKLLILSAVCFVIGITHPGIWSAKLEDILKKGEIIHKVYAAQNFKISDSGSIRRGIWEGTLNLIFSSPKSLLLGTGPETFAYTFQSVRPKSLNYSSEWEYILNKPHNYYLEIWATTGLLGLLSYLGLIIWILKKSTKESKPALISLFVSNFFSWPVTVLNLYMWLCATDNNEDN